MVVNTWLDSLKDRPQQYDTLSSAQTEKLNINGKPVPSAEPLAQRVYEKTEMILVSETPPAKEETTRGD